MTGRANRGLSRGVRFALCALALVLAPVMLFQGNANAGKVSSPFYALNGFNLADLARATLQVRQQEGEVSVSVAAAGVDLARRAFAAEPLASNALFVLAVDARTQGDRGRAQDLLDGAVALDKRNRFLGALQLEDAARAEDFARTFALVDRLATVNPRMAEDFVQPLVLALRQDAVVPVMRDALADDPVWAREFWLAVPRDAAIATRMYRLRQQTAIGASAETDARLIAALAATGQYEAAFSLRDSLAGNAAEGTGFVAAGGNPPFGWEARSSGERSMMPRGEQYDVFVQQGTEGELARQLLRLGPGRYQFSANVTPVSVAQHLSVKLECATMPGLGSQQLALDGRTVWAVPGTCSTWWLVLSGSAWEVRDGVRATLADMRFEALE